VTGRSDSRLRQPSHVAAPQRPTDSIEATVAGKVITLDDLRVSSQESRGTEVQLSHIKPRCILYELGAFFISIYINEGGMEAITFTKGEAAGNDFLILLDPEGLLDFTPELARKLCDRRLGVGADGVLRTIRTRQLSGPAALANEAEWFMDQRNADGSVCEMCANGVLVYARYLVESNLVPHGRFRIATRAGLRAVSVSPTGIASVDMGRRAHIGSDNVPIGLGDRSVLATPVFLDIPHAVSILDEKPADLLKYDFSRPPAVSSRTFPSGVNLELVTAVDGDGMAMRVYERGVGETLSCGSCACAGAAAWLATQKVQSPAEVKVHCRGGSLTVVIGENSMLLSGSPVLGAEGKLREELLMRRLDSAVWQA
jgi:diaminopimelate epimerase